MYRFVQLPLKTNFGRDEQEHPREINTKTQEETFNNKHSGITCDSNKLETTQISIDRYAVKEFGNCS